MYNDNDEMNFGMQNNSNPDMDDHTEPVNSSNDVHNPERRIPESQAGTYSASQNPVSGDLPGGGAGSVQPAGAGTYQTAAGNDGAGGMNGDSAGGSNVNVIQAGAGSADANRATAGNMGTSNPNGSQTHGWEQRRVPQLEYASREPKHHEDDRKRRSGGSFGRKVAGVTAAALLFGTVAGGTMYGVNTAANHYLGGASEAAQGTTIAESVAPAETQPEISAPVTMPRASTALAMDVSDIVEQAMPSVVAINNTMLYQGQTWFGQTQTYEVPSSGSGIIVGQNDEELLIVTNNHVVADSKTLSVTFIDNSSVEAAIKGTDSESDLAVIAVPITSIESDTMSQIKVASLGDSDALKVGQGVIAIGNALGYGQSVTVGYVSAMDREVKTESDVSRNLLQTDAAINPGNSGGALLNMKGEVIGINAAKYSSTDVEGMGYAIPISKAQDIINELMNKKTRVEVAVEKQGYLGIQGQNIDETAAEMYGMPRGIYVFKIVEGGAAAESGLREKDIITKFDGQTVRTMADLKEMLTYYEGGSTVTLTVQSLQDGQYVERSVDITLGSRPETEAN